MPDTKVLIIAPICPHNLNVRPLVDGLAAQTYGNIIATSPAKADDPAVKALVEVLQGPEVAKFIEETYDGAVVPLFG